MRGPLSYKDATLLKTILRDYLEPPSPLPYALMDGRADYVAGVYNSYRVTDPAFATLKRVIREIFDGMPKGFFVEAGAVDGEFLSNTLALERDLGWTGLLVEADGDMYHHLRGKHRKAWTSHACLAPRPFPHREILIKYSGSAVSQPGTSMYARGHGVLASAEAVSPLRMAGGDLGGSVPLYESVQCLPLASLLLALNVSHVEFVSLDVEGAEPAILDTFPWQDIVVDAWLVEHVVNASHSDSGSETEGSRVEDSTLGYGSNTKASKTHQDAKFVDFFTSRGCNHWLALCQNKESALYKPSSRRPQCPRMVTCHPRVHEWPPQFLING
ncbi:uncharacterized protein LOC122250050 [Penaeus japonicus]|uniref:uncharacterized protein LOC122250050 n=1 Tax=Penaeus japonicus TaxID=27405 RepID=UPI001C70D920|nr:uncharacterized protein LOC122250050 [Penaeus japonicus]